MATVYKVEGELVAHGASQSFTGVGTIYDYAHFRTATGRVNLDAMVLTHNLDPIFSPGVSGTFYVTKSKTRSFLLAATVNGENFDARPTLKKVINKGGGLIIDLGVYAGLAMLLIGIANPIYIAGAVPLLIGFGPFWILKRRAQPRIPQGEFNGPWMTTAVPLNA
jgi:hypothetical protein